MNKFNDLLQRIDSALRLIDREIWIVTAAHRSRRGGLVATSVSTASIDPARPVLQVGLSPNHFTTELVEVSKAFAAHLLRADQIELAWNFTRDSGRSRDKLAELALSQEQTGVPILADCLAWFDCRVFARYDAGDRLFFWADVVAAAQSGPHAPREEPVPRAPLCEHEFISRLTDEQRQTLRADHESDTQLNRTRHEFWRSTNPW